MNKTGHSPSEWKETQNRVVVGRFGEDAAWAFLEQLGYTLLHRNWRSGRFELDLVTLSPQGVLVFVEVKANRTRTHGSAAERVDKRKQGRLQRLAQSYVIHHPPGDVEMRFDVMSVEPEGDGVRITHYPNAFLPANSGYFGF
jgi:putative endonuclease